MPPRRLCAIAAATAFLLLSTAPATAQTVPPTPSTGQSLGPQLVISHRGLAYDNPEHTFFSYDAAVRADTDVIECDLQLTKDGILVCMHDTTVDRTAPPNTGRVDSFTLAQLRQMDFGSWYNTMNPTRAQAKFVGAEIVPFEEQLRCYSRYNPKQRFHVETKAPAEYGGKMEPELLALLAKYDLIPSHDVDPATARIFIQSFELTSLQIVAQLAPTLTTAYLMSVPPQDTLDGTLPAGIDIAAPTYQALLADPTYIANMHAKGHPVHTYTVDDAPSMDALLALGTDGIFSNRSDILRAEIDAHGQGTTKAERGNATSIPDLCPGIAGTVTTNAAGSPAPDPVPVPAVPEGRPWALAVAGGAAILAALGIRRRRSVTSGG